MDYLQTILDWSEVWSPLIPLTVFFIKRPKSNWVKPVVWYLVVAVLLILCADIVWKRKFLHIETWFVENLADYFRGTDGRISNNMFYNILSVSRFLLFAWFFNYLGTRFKKINRFIPLIFLLLAIVNYSFFKNINDFSSRQLAIEATLLLFYCLLYFHMVNLDDRIESPLSLPHFWVVTGLAIYTAVNFFIFLFYSYLMVQSEQYAKDIWNVHNISYIILNLFIALALYKAR